MKHLIALVFLSLSSLSWAGGPHGWDRHHHHHRHYHPHYGWVVPAIIGGAVVYAITRPDPVIVSQPPVVTMPPDVVYIEGIPYRKQLVMINGHWQEVLVRI